MIAAGAAGRRCREWVAILESVAEWQCLTPRSCRPGPAGDPQREARPACRQGCREGQADREVSACACPGVHRARVRAVGPSHPVRHAPTSSDIHVSCMQLTPVPGGHACVIRGVIAASQRRVAGSRDNRALGTTPMVAKSYASACKTGCHLRQNHGRRSCHGCFQAEGFISQEFARPRVACAYPGACVDVSLRHWNMACRRSHRPPLLGGESEAFHWVAGVRRWRPPR
jgi:hypothetical protein